jgi:hypothetical protein
VPSADTNERSHPTVDSFFSEGAYPLHDAFAQRFLTRLRARAAAWTTDVTPGDTIAETTVNPLAISVAVPGFTGDRSTLWVLCHHPADQPPSLRGWWGDPSYIEGDIDPVRRLAVEGLPLDAEVLADFAAQWLERNLLLDLHRDEWNRGRPSHRDAQGTVPPFRQGRRTRVNSVLERTSGHATAPSG